MGHRSVAHTWTVAASATLALAWSGCLPPRPGDEGSDAGTAASCTSDFTPCGGDVVGTWTIQRSCLAFELERALADVPSCRGLPAAVVAELAGTVSYESGGTRSAELTLTGTETWTIPAACLDALGADRLQTCRDATTRIDALLTVPYSSIECRLSGSTCTCVIREARMPSPFEETSRWSVDGTVLVGEEPTDRDDFCVSGDALSLRGSGYSMTLERMAPPASCPDVTPDTALPGSMCDTLSASAPDYFAASCVRASSPERTFAFRAPVDGRFFVQTTGAAFDTVLSVIRSCGTPTELACDDDGGDGTHSRIELSLAADEEVVVVVEAYGSGSSGSFCLEWGLL